MSAFRVLLVAALLSALTACNSDDGTGGSAFRNLGKRGDSNLGAESARAAAQ